MAVGHSSLTPCSVTHTCMLQFMVQRMASFSMTHNGQMRQEITRTLNSPLPINSCALQTIMTTTQQPTTTTTNTQQQAAQVVNDKDKLGQDSEDEAAYQQYSSDEQTAFRRWHSAPPQGPVPGLRRVLEEAGLSSYVAAVESWCCSEGAAFVFEVLEELESLSQALSLTPEQHLHMGAALQEATPTTAMTAAKRAPAMASGPGPQSLW
mmetsp:Transcript_85955/g.221299  ORF Transcript_85955/g.221299 Transcript_85955/m.221299 type:complete len:208 (+) Transcript_85955:111-734(+)